MIVTEQQKELLRQFEGKSYEEVIEIISGLKAYLENRRNREPFTLK